MVCSKYSSVELCFAVIVIGPLLWIVIVFPLILAIAGFELVYSMVPELFDIGWGIVKLYSAPLNVLIILFQDIVGVELFQ